MLRFLRRWPILATAVVALLALDAKTASSGPPSPPGVVKKLAPNALGGSYLRALGPRATELLAPTSGLLGANVALPYGVRAEDLGLDPVAPGIGRMRASAQKVNAFIDAHPDLHVEVAPPLHLLNDRAGTWVRSIEARNTRGADGRGVMVGVADTGVDVLHDEMRDANGKSRVAWLLDLSLVPLGVHKDLEAKFSIKNDAGELIQGAVLSRDMIDELITDVETGACDEAERKCSPSDEIGHGTHVAGIAAASGAKSKYAGMAPAADIVAVRVTRTRSEVIEPDDLQRAVEFMFTVADQEKKPLVANISLGSDFGPHDGTFMWEQVIASSIGPDHPGRAVVAAAGNVGSIVQSPLHQSVRVSKGTTMKVPVRTFGADAGSVQIWVTMRPGAEMSIGLDGPDGEWISPVPRGEQAGKNTNEYNAGVIHGSGLEGSPIPAASNGGVVVWTGAWPSGTYYVTLEGEGMAELYMEALGDASLGGDKPAFFANAVREGTLSAPATHPSVISVGCTVNRAKYRSITGSEIGLTVPLLDESGGKAFHPASDDEATARDITEGEVCWFSSAGPNANGAPKPEIAAPGALVVSAMSRNAAPGAPGSVFTSGSCPRTPTGGADKRCLQIDANHGVAIGTSMSAPVVSGVIALLFQQDPTLTQDKLVALLQGGAHPFRGVAPFMDQSGPGEVDAMGALDALDRMRDPKLFLPSANKSWITLSSEYVPADGSTPVTAIVELRTEDGEHRADMFEANRLAPVLLVENKPIDFPPEIQRRGPGVWVYTWKPPPGLGGSRATFGAAFDGAPIVTPRIVPIATDRWTAAYPSDAKGSGCAMQPSSSRATPFGVGLLALLFLRRRRVTPPRA